jgi:serine/threonine protein kinase
MQALERGSGGGGGGGGGRTPGGRRWSTGSGKRAGTAKRASLRDSLTNTLMPAPDVPVVGKQRRVSIECDVFGENPSSLSEYMHGVLEKRGQGIFGRWQLRAFKLEETTAQLAYKSSMKGKLKLAGRVVSARAASADGKRIYRFNIIVKAKAAAERILRCSAESEQEMQLWLEALRRATGSPQPAGDMVLVEDADEAAVESGGATAGPRELRTESKGLLRARTMQEKAQSLLDRFGMALSALDKTLAVGSELPIFGFAIGFLRECMRILNTISEMAQDVLDFSERLIEAAGHLKAIAGVVGRFGDELRQQLTRQLERVEELFRDGCEALSKFGKRGWLAAMIKAAYSLKTFGKISSDLREKFQQIQITIQTANIGLTLELKEQAPFAAEAAVARQVEAILKKQGGDAAKAADVEKAAAAVVADERALRAIKVETGLGETLFMAEMDLLHADLAALAAGQDALREGAEARHMEVLHMLKDRNQSRRGLMDMYEFVNAEGTKCKKKKSLMGVGVSGKVYRMRNKTDGEIFAVKIVNLESAKGVGINIEKLRHETHAMLALNHRHIIRYFNTCMYEYEVDGETVEEYCMVMELAPGGTLQALIAKPERLSEEHIEKLLLQMVSALEHIHEEGMVHRDLKPDNVLLSERGAAKICDLGLACLAQSKASMTAGAGTGTYMSPEKGLGKPYGFKDDIWAIGCILFELVTKTPMSVVHGGALGLYAVLEKIDDDVVGAVKAVYPRAHFSTLLRAMLAEDPAARPTAAELGRSLSLGSSGGGRDALEAAKQWQRRKHETQRPLLQATLLRLVRGAWCERRVELARGGLLIIFEQDRHETKLDFSDVFIDIIETPTVGQLANLAAAERSEGKAVPARKLTGSRRSASSDVRPPSTHSAVFALLSGGSGGGVALAATSVADMEAWTGALRRESLRFPARLAECGTGSCPWYQVRSCALARTSSARYSLCSRANHACSMCIRSLCIPCVSGTVQRRRRALPCRE